MSPCSASECAEDVTFLTPPLLDSGCLCGEDSVDTMAAAGDVAVEDTMGEPFFAPSTDTFMCQDCEQTVPVAWVVSGSCQAPGLPFEA